MSSAVPVTPKPVLIAQVAPKPEAVPSPPAPKKSAPKKSKAAPVEDSTEKQRSATLRVSEELHGDLRICASVLRKNTYELTNQLIDDGLRNLCKQHPALAGIIGKR